MQKFINNETDGALFLALCWRRRILKFVNARTPFFSFFSSREEKQIAALEMFLKQHEHVRKLFSKTNYKTAKEILARLKRNG